MTKALIHKELMALQDLFEPTTSPTRERTELSSSSHSASSSQSSSRVLYSGPKVKLPKLSLKTFNGDLTTWTTFWDTFESSIHNNTDLSAIDKFNYLNSLLEGNAATAVSGLTLSSANYDEAVVILTKKIWQPSANHHKTHGRLNESGSSNIKSQSGGPQTSA